MPELDRYAPYLLAALGITWAALGGYIVYLWSRLRGLQRRIEQHERSRPDAAG